MAIATAAVTLDIADQLGNDLDSRRTKVWITTNIPGDTVIDKAGNKIRLGSGNVTLNADGTGSMLVWVPGADANPSSWQTTVHVDYPDRNAPKGRTTKSFGPFTITTNADLADLVAEMPVQPEYLATVLETVQDMIDEATGGTGPALAALADRLDGVNDHGDVSGTLLLNPAKGFHVFDATGATTVELGTPPGNSLAFKAITGADQVEVDGLPDLELTDNAWATFVYYRGAWDLAAAGAGGGGSVEPVTDPPTQPGAISVDPTSDGYNLSWVASTVAAGYEVQVDGGSWVDSGANLTHAYTGLAAGSSHSGAVRAYNSLGAKSTARGWGPASVDTVGLHEQLLALNAPVYLRFTNGTMEDFGNAGITWSQSGFTPAADLDGGPGLAPGDASSARFPNGAGLRTTNLQGAFTNKTAMTIIALVHTIDGADGGTRLFQVPALGAFGMSVGSFNEAVSAGSTHLLVGTWKDGETGVQWRDGVAVNVDGFSWTNGVPTTDPDAKEAWMFRNREFGSFNSGTDLAYLVALPGTDPLTEAQIMALTVAAGTVGNPR